MAWLINGIYLTVIVLASPWLVYAAVFKGKYREGWAEKLWGHLPARTGEAPCVWFHAVSVGEVNLLPTLVARFQQQHPNWHCVVTTTTHTGYALARRRFPNLTVSYCPLDFSWAAANALRRVRPNLLVLVELEIWPNLLRLGRRRGVKLAVVNGRLSQNSLRGYRRLGRLIRPLFAGLHVVAAQNATYADAFRTLGTPRQAVHNTGSMKFDGAQTDRHNPRTRELARLAGIGGNDIVLLAGSTQEPEEELALRAFQELAAEYPQLRLILVPRHPERFERVADLLQRSGVAWSRRSQLSQDRPTERILLVDTIGELAAWWGTAQIAYVGGSMGSRGGQNMIEPAAYGAAVSFGPNTQNFRDIVALLLEQQAAVMVRNGVELSQFVRRCLADPHYARQLGTTAQQVVRSQLGATEKTLALLEELCDEAHSQRRAA